MISLIENYEQTVVVIGLVGLMQLIQLLIADGAGIKTKKTPGVSADVGHHNFVWRAERAFMNTNESISIFLMLVLFCLLSSADAKWVNTWAMLYAGSRFLHMLFYYFNIKLARSAVFGISLVALAGLFYVGIVQWL